MKSSNRSKVRKLLLRATQTVNVMGTITHVWTRHPVAALTFDGGPDPRWTPRLLDILARHQVHATFFMIGKHAASHPDIVRQVARAGHTIGNHSWDHPSFPLLSSRERRHQVRACAQAIAPYGRHLFRPPYGHQDLGTRLDLALLAHKVVTWNLHVYDWEERDADWMVAQLESHIHPGSIILLHDVNCMLRDRSREATLQATDTLLQRNGGRFRFVTVPELLRYGLPQKQKWHWNPNIDWLNALSQESELQSSNPHLHQSVPVSGPGDLK
jgi:peptidoglycan/xylan/chitin deacetylase (PgdA/CDA1 family)